jgi:hypothetical protein
VDGRDLLGIEHSPGVDDEIGARITAASRLACVDRPVTR